MVGVSEHYENLLASVYLWMAGGFDAAVSLGESEIAAIYPESENGLAAVDLGAGFGMHAIPLACRGCAVVAIDSSARLLGELQHYAGALPICIVQDDLLSFQKHLAAKVHLILCMGDTLTHLPDTAAVERLFSLVGESLHAGGRFVASFRDYTSPLPGEERFIPVRSDDDRILTCFLEYGADCVTVHDLLYERNGSGWQQRVSAYRKLRLSPQWVADALRAIGFAVRTERGLAGMVRIVADKPKK